MRGLLFVLVAVLAGCGLVGPRADAPVAATPPAPAYPRADANLSLLVTNRAGRPVAGALVMLHGPRDPLQDAPPPRIVLEMIDDRLLPRAVAIPVGGAVAFRNASELAHEIYTFSKPRPFAARLTPGAPPATFTFDKPGLVVLGCKLHGDTIAHIYVSDAVRSGTTDADGYLRLTGLMPGDHRAVVWRAGGREAQANESEKRFSLEPGKPRLVRISVR